MLRDGTLDMSPGSYSVEPELEPALRSGKASDDEPVN
jgi:hypothetical protein